MGVVWLAEQTRPVRRQVALKIIKAGMDTAQVVARFEAERQALALMNHPAIASAFDAGATPEGRPYFVMEYVRGESITAYCTRHRLSIGDRLGLFLQVCDGVQHAHQKGVIHRDLKPSNVLVTVQDDHPVPKIIDFGVAKATTQTLTERTLNTEFGALVGTPEYMSPEQAEMSGLDVDTRTDVYALGAILYELLTGALPFESRALREKGLEAIRRTIREVDPPRPSSRVTTLAATAAAAAQRQPTDSSRHARQLQGDLDWITMKALEKDRTRRYGSASDLAADLQRHLDHLPVLASPPSTIYRVAKFVRRHRVGVATTATLGVLLIAFAATMAIQARRIARERDRASREEAAANAVNSFLRNDLLAQAGASAQASPDIAPDPDLKVRTALDRAAARIGGKFDQQPLIEGSIRQTIGETYLDLGLFAEARQQLDRVLELRRRLLGDEHADTLRTIEVLASLDENQADYAAAERRYTTVLDGRRRVLGSQHPNVLRTLNNLGWIDYRRGRFSQAEARLTEALAAEQRVLGPDDPLMVSTMSNLGVTYLERGAPKQAEPLLSLALAARRRTLGAEHPTTLSVMERLALVYGQQAQYAKAEAIRREVFEVRRRTLGPEHPATLIAMTNFGLVLVHQQQDVKTAQAEDLLTKVLLAARRVLGEHHRSTIAARLNLGELYELQSKYGEAERLFREAFDTAGASLGPQHPATLDSLAALGRVLVSQGKHADAEPLLRDVLDRRTRVMPDSWRRFAEQSVLGDSLAGQRKRAEAEPLLLSGYDGLVQRTATIPAYERGHVTRAGQRIIRLYEAWGKPAQATEWRNKLSAAERPIG
jgi:non-specific serine/threonine protein kinase/serine/threonine-protein kinase